MSRTHLPQAAQGASLQLFRSRGGALQWRLLAANNRELGRSAREYLDAETALLDAKHVAFHADALRRRLSRRTGGRWDWQLLDAGEVVAESVTGYDRQVRCLQAASRFVLVVRWADIGRSSSRSVPVTDRRERVRP